MFYTILFTYGHRRQSSVVIYASLVLRYIVIAGLFWFVFYIRRNKQYISYKIQLHNPKRRIVNQEIMFSLTSFIIFTIVALGALYMYHLGYTQIYIDIHDHSIAYFLVSIILMIIVHDAYFYRTHRLLHTKYFWRAHRIHHHSTNPTPRAAFSFHPIEALIQVGIIPLIVFTIPSHPAAIAIFLIIMTILNVLGHLGYELFPPKFTSSMRTRRSNTSTHHNMHHTFLRSNFGLYFNRRDVWGKTNHPDYKNYYAQIIRRRTNKN